MSRFSADPLRRPPPLRVGRLLTRDRDFSRFPWIDVVDLDQEPDQFA